MQTHTKALSNPLTSRLSINSTLTWREKHIADGGRRRGGEPDTAGLGRRRGGGAAGEGVGVFVRLILSY